MTIHNLSAKFDPSTNALKTCAMMCWKRKNRNTIQNFHIAVDSFLPVVDSDQKSCPEVGVRDFSNLNVFSHIEYFFTKRF